MSRGRLRGQRAEAKGWGDECVQEAWCEIHKKLIKSQKEKRSKRKSHPYPSRTNRFYICFDVTVHIIFSFRSASLATFTGTLSFLLSEHPKGITDYLLIGLPKAYSSAICISSCISVHLKICSVLVYAFLHCFLFLCSLWSWSITVLSWTLSSYCTRMSWNPQSCLSLNPVCVWKETSSLSVICKSKGVCFPLQSSEAYKERNELSYLSTWFPNYILDVFYQQ